MSDPLIRSCSHYVILEPGKQEKICTTEETRQWLEKWLLRLETLPEDLQQQPNTKSAVQRLLDTACDLEIEPGFSLRWFAVRLNPPEI